MEEVEEGAKVRLVRCPKCENLLPELPDFSVYQCGGCGAVLRAKNKGIVENEMSEKSDNAKKGIGDSEGSTIVKDSNLNLKSLDQIEGIKLERAVDNGNSVLVAKSTKTLSDSDMNKRGKERQESSERVSCKNRASNMDSSENDYFKTDRIIRSPVKSLRSMPINNGLMASREHDRNSTTQGRFSNFNYLNEGQLSYGTSSHYKHMERTRNLSQDLDELLRIEKSEPGHADLLRKIDELKDQLSRTSDVEGKLHSVMPCSTSTDPFNRNYNGYSLDSSSNSQVRNRQPLASGDPYLYINKPRFIPPRADMYSTSVPDSYLQMGLNPPELTRYNEPYRPQMIQRNYPNSQYMYWPYGEYVHGYHGDFKHGNFFHQPACSCAQCCNKNWCLPPMIDRRGSHNRRNAPSNPNYHRTQSINPRSNDFDSENEGFLSCQRPRKFVTAQRSRQVSYPIAGGAPFITCNNCFELLKLPRKITLLPKDRHQIKCGACSSVILFEPGGDNNGVVASVSADIEHLHSEIDEHSSSGMFDENVGYWNNCSNIADFNSTSNDFDESQQTKSSSPFEKKSGSRESAKPLDSFSSSTSCDEKIPENKSSRKHGSSLSKIPLEKVNSLLHTLDHCNNGDKSSRSEQESVSSLGRNSSRQISLKDAAVETEDDMPLNEISNRSSSQDSVETHEEDRSKVSNKAGKSFFGGLIKRSFRDSTKSNAEVGKTQEVFVNGHLIPHDLVKKAEKMAGPIQPGEYWYDKRAGFWGAMGQPCSGIIMPNIEEFNYPMPKNCGAGNTGIFVNSRELHQQDLDLLANRGLPITRNRSYLIVITGEVVDEHTGEELDPLGKLAPTVEKVKRGFGMKAPKGH